MPSSFTSRLKLERQASGENSGNWGNLVNYVFNRIDSSTKGYQAVSVAGNANVTLTSNNSTTNTDDSTTDDQVHNAVLEFTGALTGNINVFTDAVETNYTVFNNTSGSHTLTFAPTGGTGVELKQGAKTLVYTDGNTMFDVMADLGDITATSGNFANVEVTTTANVNNFNAVGIANTGSSVYFKLPSADGTAGQALTTDASGQLAFADVVGGLDWQAVISSNVTATASQGFFVNTAANAVTVTLPATPTRGDEVGIVDYTGNASTNNITVGRNSENIQGSAADLTVGTDRAAFTLVYSDSTQGWLLKDN